MLRTFFSDASFFSSKTLFCGWFVTCYFAYVNNFLYFSFFLNDFSVNLGRNMCKDDDRCLCCAWCCDAALGLDFPWVD